MYLVSGRITHEIRLPGRLVPGPVRTRTPKRGGATISFHGGGQSTCLHSTTRQLHVGIWTCTLYRSAALLLLMLLVKSIFILKKLDIIKQTRGTTRQGYVHSTPPDNAALSFWRFSFFCETFFFLVSSSSALGTGSSFSVRYISTWHGELMYAEQEKMVTITIKYQQIKQSSTDNCWCLNARICQPSIVMVTKTTKVTYPMCTLSMHFRSTAHDVILHWTLRLAWVTLSSLRLNHCTLCIMIRCG